MAENTAPPKPTPAELDLLRVLWQLRSATAKQVHLHLLASRPDVTYANVLRQLQIMHGKGLLTRDESQRSHVYAAAQSQDTLQTNLLQDLITKVFAGSGKALVMAALRGHVTRDERNEIERFLHNNDRDKQ